MASSDDARSSDRIGLSSSDDDTRPGREIAFSRRIQNTLQNFNLMAFLAILYL